ncbi:uncharacterized protein (DUF736 family) [Sphingobium sp. B11D3B]|uniref:DUF736 domain-containing protein n=1 Tax=Sphingobium sp. B11D3B TaxID=2940575 RepID=UPI0022275628|nr:DUF736 domain-containing protein [Sphingobium sp. B11D3B]MCW2387138.1 uncharacterized protein (DUF736 family) [Sphingobium sp. B11D3B]
MQIGCFQSQGDGFTGRLQTLTLDVALQIVPTGFSGQERAPDWRVHLRDADAPDGIGPEVGSGWNHEGKSTTYIALQLDCPGLIRSVRANLLRSKQDENAHVLLWSPRLRRPKAE